MRNRIRIVTVDVGIKSRVWMLWPKNLTTMALFSFSAAVAMVLLFTLHERWNETAQGIERLLRTRSLDASPVKVLLLTEALCPDCKRFMLEQLLGAYNLLGDEVMEITLVPFGNARIDAENKIVQCQHGVGECDANSYEQCTIAAFPDPSQYLPMLACLDETLPMGSHETLFPSEPFEHCANQAGLPFPRIQGCHGNHELAWRFQQSAAAATPDYHEYVPWLEINGEHMDESGDLIAQVCTVFKASGGSHPACEIDISTAEEVLLSF